MAELMMENSIFSTNRANMSRYLAHWLQQARMRTSPCDSNDPMNVGYWCECPADTTCSSCFEALTCTDGKPHSNCLAPTDPSFNNDMLICQGALAPAPCNDSTDPSNMGNVGFWCGCDTYLPFVKRCSACFDKISQRVSPVTQENLFYANLSGCLGV